MLMRCVVSTTWDLFSGRQTRSRPIQLKLMVIAERFIQRERALILRG
jgi:hypothetical protein